MKKLILIIIVAMQSCMMPPTGQNALSLELESVEHEGEGYHGGTAYQDSLIMIRWEYSTTSLGFTLQNRSNKTIKVLWEEASFIDEKGQSNRIMHNGVKYIDRSQSQPASTVMRGATLTDEIVPVNKAVFVSGQYGGWVTRPIFETNAWSATETAKMYDAIRGKKVAVLLPIVSEGRTREFIFNFVIK